MRYLRESFLCKFQASSFKLQLTRFRRMNSDALGVEGTVGFVRAHALNNVLNNFTRF